MEPETRKLGLRPLFVVAAVIAVAVTVWAAGALAAGGGSTSSDSPADSSASFIQAREDGQPPSREDCPEGRGGGGAPERGDGSGSPDL